MAQSEKYLLFAPLKSEPNLDLLWEDLDQTTHKVFYYPFLEEDGQLSIGRVSFVTGFEAIRIF